MIDWLQWAIIAFITIGIACAFFWGGMANPESTGVLSRKLSQLSHKMVTLESDVKNVEDKVDKLERESATTKDIQRLEERIATVRAEMAGHRELAERTNKSVIRIEDHLLGRAFEK